MGGDVADAGEDVEVGSGAEPGRQHLLGGQVLGGPGGTAAARRGRTAAARRVEPVVLLLGKRASRAAQLVESLWCVLKLGAASTDVRNAVHHSGHHAL